jgi:DNA-directed RNA polymerase subunit RPC12/RpoP
MNWLKKLMAGRYGCDQLSVALIALSCLPILAAGFSGRTRITCLAYIPLGLCLYRALSRQLQKRRLENDRFMMSLSRMDFFIKEVSGKIRDLKNYKYFRCPNCGQKLRVPRGKGTVKVICFHCHTEFKKKT